VLWRHALLRDGPRELAQQVAAARDELRRVLLRVCAGAAAAPTEALTRVAAWLVALGNVTELLRAANHPDSHVDTSALTDVHGPRYACSRALYEELDHTHNGFAAAADSYYQKHMRPGFERESSGTSAANKAFTARVVRPYPQFECRPDMFEGVWALMREACLASGDEAARTTEREPASEPSTSSGGGVRGRREAEGRGPPGPAVPRRVCRGEGVCLPCVDPSRW
jgi:hypothetical protein